MTESLDIHRWISIILTFVFSSIGLFGYIIFVYVICKDRQQRFSNRFYALALSWSVPEMYRVVQGLIVSIPILVLDSCTGDDSDCLGVPKWYRTVSGFLYLMAWLAAVSHMLALGVNRVMAVYWPTEYKRMYTHTKCALIGLFIYFYSVFMTCLLLFGECRANFVGYSWKMVAFSADSKPNETVPWSHCSQVVYKMYLITSIGQIVLTIVCALCTAIGLFNIKQHLNEFRNRSIRRWASKQWSLTAQFSFTVISLVISICVYWTVPIAASKGFVSSNSASVFVNTTTLLCDALNPYVYILLGSMIRTQIFGLHKHTNQRHNANMDRTYVMRSLPSCAASVDELRP